ncbi:MAG: hypothetical protein HFH86_04045, partial [Bacilli bacterium]|nr:hypothetical protein [Bacilli bacterium]
HTGVTVASSTSGSNGWYTALSKKVTLSDGHSGVASAKYCFTTGSSCTPGTAAAISSNAFTASFGGNASAQKICWNITDNAGNTSGTACDGTTYKVDTLPLEGKLEVYVNDVPQQNVAFIGVLLQLNGTISTPTFRFLMDGASYYNGPYNNQSIRYYPNRTVEVCGEVTNEAGRSLKLCKSIHIPSYEEWNGF